MKDYKLKTREVILLDALDVRDCKTINGLTQEVNMNIHTVEKNLMSLKAKGLADFTQYEEAQYWRAL